MPLLFVFSIFLFLVWGGALVTAVLGRKNEDVMFPAAIVAVIALIGGSLSLIFSSFNSVGTYDIGVTTSFGKVLGYDGPGAHWIAPWENMSLMDESTQTVNDTVTVRVSGQQTATAEVKLRVQLVPSATDSLFRQYKGNTQNVILALVEPELNVAMNGVYDGYDPILPLSTGAKPGTPDNPTTQQLSDAVKAKLKAAIGTQVSVNTLVVQPLRYDQTVENRINSVLAQTAKTDVAKQSEQTAAAQAAANKLLQQNITPLTLVQQCMNSIADGQLNPPAGFSCWPGQSSGVVIPSK